MTQSTKKAALSPAVEPPREGQGGIEIERHDALIEVVDAVRTLIGQTVSLDGSVDALQDVAASLRAVSETMAPMTGHRPFPKFVPGECIHGPDPNVVLPYSPVSGRFHPMAPPMTLKVVGERLEGHATFDASWEGPNRCVHGGLVSLVYDQLLAFSNVARDVGGPTAWLHVEYRKPTPLYVPLRFECWVDRVEGRKVFSKGCCYAGDVLITEAEGLFIRPDVERSGHMWKNERGVG